jgi:SAM-dependent methyltransferase
MRDFYKELSEFTGRDYELVKARCIIAHIELAWLWEEYEDRPLDFYRETDWYIFGLSNYQTRMVETKNDIWYQYQIRTHGWKKGLDLGGGIGEQTILAMEQGVEDMTYVDVEGSKTREYAEWRFNKYNVKPKIENENFIINEDYDFIVAMDILEHLPNPEPIIENLAKHTEWLFCNPEYLFFDKWNPQHISKFDLTKYFIKEEIYLWKRR